MGDVGLQTRDEARLAEAGETQPTRGVAEQEASFWHRPVVEQWLVPLVLPLVVIGAILAYVMNVSRLFLAGHGAVPTIVGTVVTLMILLGASWLAKASNLKSSQVALVAVGGIAVIAGAGWLMLGTSAPEEVATGPLPTNITTTQKFVIEGGGGSGFVFEPSEINATTGLAKFEVSWKSGSHSFEFTDPSVRSAPVPGTKSGETVAFFAEPGEYEYICPTAGHAASGMKGKVKVEGNPTTLEQALADTGNPPEAATGGGEGE